VKISEEKNMRITNTMMTNTTLININRNMRRLDTLIQQIESTKKIQVPSDDPIVASRALKFRTSVAENEQFQRNVKSGMAWMEVSEASFMDITRNLMTQLNELLVASATGSLELPDKLANVSAMRELVAQIGLDMNQTYAGRYVFSGFRTDQPPVLNENNNNSYIINQFFDVRDIEKALSYQKITTDGIAISHPINVMKLPYKIIDTLPPGNDTAPANITIPGYTVRTFRPNDPLAYSPIADGEIHFIQGTGELVMNTNTAENFTDNTQVTYVKTNFAKGELNPLVYFSCTDLKTGIVYEMERIDPVTGLMINLHEIQYEFTTNTYITINSLSKNIYTDKMFADFMRLFDFADSLIRSDPKLVEAKFSSPPHNLTGDELKKAVDDQLINETALVNAVLHDRFNNMLYLLDRHSSNAMKEHTQLGSRMYRMELMQIRLEEDEASYTKLMSENEDTDMARAIILKAAAEAAYTASLRASANIMQLSLANFIG
jgi:flagellar hook-associated protein 3 FlgL